MWVGVVPEIVSDSDPRSRNLSETKYVGDDVVRLFLRQPHIGHGWARAEEESAQGHVGHSARIGNGLEIGRCRKFFGVRLGG